MAERNAAKLGVFCCLLAVSSAAAGPPAAATREAAPIPQFQIPPGFVVEKAAGPPLVRYPLFACFDDRGRLFVAEGTGTNLPGDELRARKLGRILLLEDRDGDGTFDTSRVFADGLVFPQGVLWHDGVVYTASHPSIWRLEDPEQRGAASRRTELVNGFGFNGNGCDIHGPFLGPDGRLYWTDGRHGYKVRTRDGASLEGLAARIWRCRTDGTEVERLCGGGFDNPVEIAFTAEGEALGTMDQGDGDCLLHYVEGGVYPMEHPCLQEFATTGPLLGAVKQYSPVLPAALCGLVRYRSRAFGPGYQNRFLSTQYMIHKIVRHELVPVGATFSAIDADFLTTAGHDVRLTDVLEDADGSLLFIDMGAWFTYGFPGNPAPRPDALGAIYRIRRRGAPHPDDPWGKTLERVAHLPAALIARLDDPRPKVQDRALNLLVRLGLAAVPDLQKTLASQAGRPSEVRRNAVWALCRIGMPAARAAALTALDDPDQGTRLAAIHTLGLYRDLSAVGRLRALVTAGTQPVRRKAAEALGRIGRPEAVPTLLAALRQEGDRFLEHSLTYALLEIHESHATQVALLDSNPRVRRAGLLALDQMEGGQLTREQIIPLVSAADPELDSTVLRVLGRRPAWSDLAQSALRRWLATPRLGAPRDRAGEEMLTELAAHAPLQHVLAQALTSPSAPAETRALVVRTMAQARVSALPLTWVEALRHALADTSATLRHAVIGTIKLRHLADLDDALVALVRQSDEPVALRIAALECVAPRLRPLDAQAFELLTAHLAETTEPLLRLTAARTLGVCTLTHSQRIELAGAMGRSSAIVLRLLLPVFAKGEDIEVGRLLVDALSRNPSARALRLAELDETLHRYRGDVRERAQDLRRELTARQSEKTTYLTGIARELDLLRGNPDAGCELFLSARLGCYGCHRAVGRGGEVGPDLSRIGQIRTRAELLESIIYPGRTIAPQYRAVDVLLRDGRVATGLVVRDDPDGVTLRMTDLSELRVARIQIEQMKPSTASVMPEGLERLVTRQELRDLLDFLSAQR
jgi:putative heme-binding domain-containing protein